MTEISCLPEGDIIESLEAEIDRLTKELEQAEKDYKTLWDTFVGE